MTANKTGDEEVASITTEEEYKEALAEVDRLWGSPAGSVEERQCERLAMLIHNYERQHFPIPEPTPIEAIKFRMDQMGIQDESLIKEDQLTLEEEDDLAGVSTDFKGTHVVIACVAVASYGFSPEELVKAKWLANHINKAIKRHFNR
jgi:hypothetical protein